MHPIKAPEMYDMFVLFFPEILEGGGNVSRLFLRILHGEFLLVS